MCMLHVNDRYPALSAKFGRIRPDSPTWGQMYLASLASACHGSKNRTSVHTVNGKIQVYLAFFNLPDPPLEAFRRTSR
ncbi:uncharacterized protein PgNI_12293 [Pyricularia grisea]|uniref:Uncharacterized protein n=1 Tax=Pyricularia grisea TaxID=148305 RepID=A0A6P8AN27_PYRGI|nr:uncharacterized protein PgNI_12293 [Pyricularia grisea]TLD03426.1 hypothetical protein PgNI_12293 [Pyricularia grisea]